MRRDEPLRILWLGLALCGAEDQRVAQLLSEYVDCQQSASDSVAAVPPNPAADTNNSPAAATETLTTPTTPATPATPATLTTPATPATPASQVNALSPEGVRFVAWLRELGALERDPTARCGFRLVEARNWEPEQQQQPDESTTTTVDGHSAPVLLLSESEHECVVRLQAFEPNRGRLRWTTLPRLLADRLLLGSGDRDGVARTRTRRFRRRNGRAASLKCHAIDLRRLADVWE